MDAIAIDIETTGRNPRLGDKIFAFCVAYNDGTVEVYRHNFRPHLQHFLNSHREIICHYSKFERAFFKYENYNTEKVFWHDTVLMSQLLSNLEPSHGLDNLAYKYCGYPKDQDEELEEYLKGCNNQWEQVPEDIMHRYQVADGERTMLLYKIMRPYFTGKLWDDYRNEIALIDVALEMEHNGIKIHYENAQELLKWLLKEKEKLVFDVYKKLGEYINLGSEKQLSQLLFGQLGYKPTGFTEKGNPSTDKNVLVEMRESARDKFLFNLILKWRSYTTGIANIKNYLSRIDNCFILRTTINTNQARTGRQSSSKPNLQNIAKEEVLQNPYPVPMRKVFCARRNHFLILFDYKSIELYLMAIITNCRFYKEKFLAGEDIIRRSAEIFYGKEFLDSLPAHTFETYRTAAKNATYALQYGAGADRLSVTLKMTLNQANEAIERYRAVVPELVNFSHTVASQVKAQGYVTTIFGRRLRINQTKVFSAANYLIQGTAAGVFKRAQVKLYKYFKLKYNEIKILLPIHDELICEAPICLYPDLDTIIKEAKEEVENIDWVSLRLRTSWRTTSTNWAEAKKYENKTC